MKPSNESATGSLPEKKGIGKKELCKYYPKMRAAEMWSARGEDFVRANHNDKIPKGTIWLCTYGLCIAQRDIHGWKASEAKPKPRFEANATFERIRDRSGFRGMIANVHDPRENYAIIDNGDARLTAIKFRHSKTKRKKQEDYDLVSMDSDFDARDESSTTQQERPEGRSLEFWGTRYERDPNARAECLLHYGYKCLVCGFDFEARYGRLGKGLIHVHHEKPLEQGERNTNPIEHLKPVCPNCHAMIHRNRTPLTLLELKEMI